MRHGGCEEVRERPLQGEEGHAGNIQRPEAVFGGGSSTMGRHVSNLSTSFVSQLVHSHVVSIAEYLKN